MTEGSQMYDIAVSFAGAQRTLVEPIVRACQEAALTVFYDRDKTVEFWGRNFITGMREIYDGTRARYFVPFLSREYLASAYPMDEYTTAMRRATEISADSYLLPIIVGSVEVPPELLTLRSATCAWRTTRPDSWRRSSPPGSAPRVTSIRNRAR